jgi:hypothetical protein
MIRWLIVGCALVLASPQPAAEKPETEWIKLLSKELGGEAEHRTPDGSRVDILTDKVAWEVEWARKWQEAIGQAHFYALATNRRPGIVLLLTGDKSEKVYYLRCLAVCAKTGITLRTHRIK